MRLHELTPAAGSRHRTKRVGRGIGSGHGKTACRGDKGQKARTTIRPGFEGGQTPLYMRLRKHGGRGKGAMPQRMFKREHAVLNVSSLQRIAEKVGKEAVITPQLLLEKRLLRKLGAGLRVLGGGELNLPITVHAHHFSQSAKERIEAAGGRAVVLAARALGPAQEDSASAAAEEVN
ncbi:MAG: 50S ribosomal protein L15 [Armatimonadetes bacterium]|nr:50S ribosomal protein L15 [Armatimonadota bacterium]NIO75182.1 50S ribosomal protein L15 [Armatimonadota bacterium]NIO95801.1 50S ribosomal protein L15 [Armatimonadota bacterium]